MRLLAELLVAALLAPAQQDVTFKASSNLVVVNVIVRDRKGNLLENLKKEDFQVLENGQPQTVSVFEFQRLGAEALPKVIDTISPATPTAPATAVVEQQPGEIKRYKDKRLLVLFFDMAGMPITDQIRTQESALEFVRDKLTASDVVQIMSFAATLKVDQEFTDDRQKLIETIRKFRIGTGLSPTLDPAATTDDAADDTADTSEQDLFNSDRKLAALESASRMLAPFPEKKALIYFSSGSGGAGVENQAQIRSTINAAVRSNVSFYAVDVRGLQATAPGGNASDASPKGTGMYTGATQGKQRDKQHQEQETLYALSAETGGKALLDNNDLTVGMQQAQKDLQSYYTLGFYSTNDTKDGRFRKVEVKLPAGLNAKLDYRSGYYGSKEWRAFNSGDKERQLQEALLLGDPQTDLPLALEVDWFRMNPTKYFVPLSVKIPGSVLATTRKGNAEVTEFDFIAEVRDAKGKVAGSVRDGIKVKIAGADAAELAKRSVLYDSGFTLSPGTYKLKLLARENGTGKMGTFESKFTIPDAPSMSSVVLSSQRESTTAAVGSAGKLPKKVIANHPFVQDGFRLVPNVTRGFRTNQRMYVYAEAYDITKLAASVSFFRSGHKVLESEPIRVQGADTTRKGAVPVQLQVSLKDLRPGRYTCQLNVIDETGRKFLYDRSSIVVAP